MPDCAGGGCHAHAQVPFSTFVNNVRSNEVQAVAIEGRHVAFHLRPKALARWLPWDASRGPVPNCLFRTVRPADYSTPYEAMLKHGVQFAAVEKQQNLFLTVGVRVRSLSRMTSWPDVWSTACTCALRIAHLVLPLVAGKGTSVSLAHGKEGGCYAS